MVVVAILCGLAAGTLTVAITYIESLNGWLAFLLCWVAGILAGGALSVKESTVSESEVTWTGRIGGALVVLLIFGFAQERYFALWKESGGVWRQALLALLGLIYMMALWVPLQGGEEK